MKKDIILETAARLFAERGYARTSTALLAKEAGVAEGTIFRHFSNKEDIFLALIKRLHDKMRHGIYQYYDIQGPENSIERITFFIKASYTFVHQNKTDFALILRDAPGCYGEPESQAFEKAKLIYFILQDHFQKAIEEGKTEGLIREEVHPQDTACLIATSLVGLMRVVHLGFLQPSENMLKHLMANTKAMLEKR